MSVERVSIMFLMFAIGFQQVQIMTLRTKVMFLDRKRKSMQRGMEIQGEINHTTTKLLEKLTNVYGEFVIDKFNNMINDK